MTLPTEMRLSLVQMNSTDDRDENVERASGYIDRAVDEQNPDLVVIPEFFNHSYIFNRRDHKYLELAEPESGPSLTRMRAKAWEHGIHLVATLSRRQAPASTTTPRSSSTPPGRSQVVTGR